ncbi:methyl-accepting chemotaxis protein [Cellulosilyticum sp. I15G10I2]|uniref:methyl-accepting chemotaxis protein n=1 Tax=Cellulosilyticum sp. I15G10I2 TaxID=1892843 RepID=UPI00085C042C|nr:methyl-accepting chemotaxis protein [Cellulosilyticum sp. I15G10I2]
MKRQLYLLFQVFILILCCIWYTFLPFTKYLLINSVFLICLLLAQSFLYKKQMSYISSLQEKLSNHENNYKKLGYELNVASSQVSSVSQNLYITLEENNAFTQQLFAQTEEMSNLNTSVTTNITHTITAIKQVLSVLDQVELTTSNLKEISLASSQVINTSLTEIMDILNTINEIQTSSDSTIKYMDRLNVTSKEILHILDSVHSISDQTHLLALNASIESARAGEAGKGFAVVADEIRKLSMSTSDAVKDVNTLIDSIQNELNAVNKHVLDNSKKVEIGVTKSKKIEESLEKIKVSFGEVVHLVDEISVLSTEETHLAQSVDSSIGSVESVVERTASSVEGVFDSVNKQKDSLEDIADMSSRLNESSNMLSLLLQDYKLDEISVLKQDIVGHYLDQFKKMIEQLSYNKAFIQLDKSIHSQVLKDLINSNDFIEAIWTNGDKGKFVMSIPPAGIANGSVREWFKKSISGEYYISKPYISAITRIPCITLSAPIKDPSGYIRGVIGIDIKLMEQ